MALHTYKRLAGATLMALLVAACDSDGNGLGAGGQGTMPPPATASFDITVSNLTNGQPLSPIAVIADQATFSVFEIGQPASTALEVLAEGGDNSDLIASADGIATPGGSVSGAAPIGPAGSETVSITVNQLALPGLEISVSTMLVNTNDAITGVNDVLVGDMAVGDSVTLRAIAYDAGTEANTETAATIPGPAGGGEGFNAARDDIADRVAMHAGVVGIEDGFATSDLTGQHKFDNPVALITIGRTQ